MSVLAIVGAQWGDEGKGKIVDLLAQKAQIVVRSQGGGNAGHEVWVGKKDFIMHLIPSGILHQGKVCVIGNGVVIDPTALGAEIKELRGKGVAVSPKNLVVSPLAQVTFSLHREYDAAQENVKGGTKIGTTKRGIGPTYSDKVNRVGVRVADLFHADRCRELLSQSLRTKNLVFKELFGVKGVSLAKLMKEAKDHAKILKPFVADTIEMLNTAVDKKKKILLEGAQGTMLDVDYGTYPFVTSSNSTAGGAATGSGLGPNRIEQVLGVCKAYTTRVGEGPFPTEFDQAMNDKVRDLGGEIGRTTGRARRCGWLDLVVLKHAALVNGMTWLGMTKLDVLDGMDKIGICVAYKIGSKITKRFPASIADAERAVPQYIYMKGWKSNTTKARKWSDLPDNCKKYLKRIEKEVAVPLGLVSIGPERSQTLFVDKRLEKFKF